MAGNITAINYNRSYRIDLGRAEKIAAKTLKILNKERRAELELVFVEDGAIKKLNKRYRSENRYTDVLSFRIDRREFGYKAFLGEVIISLDTAGKNSGIYGTSLGAEVVLYIIHGILHLFGYDDEKAEERRRMENKQYQILGEICQSKNLSVVLTRR